MPRRLVPRITPEGERVAAHAAEVIVQRAAAWELLRTKTKYLGVALSLMLLFKAAPVNWLYLLAAFIGELLGNREMRMFTNATKKRLLYRMLTCICYLLFFVIHIIFKGTNSDTPLIPMVFQATIVTTFAVFAFIICIRAKRNVDRAIREEGTGEEPNSDSDSDSDY